VYFFAGDMSTAVQHPHEASISGEAHASYSLEELTKVGFTAEELKAAGYNLSSLKAVGFDFKQLRDAGFDASAFKSDGCTEADLKTIGFTAQELKQAGCTFSSLKAIGFDSKQLKAAGFGISAFKNDGYTLEWLKETGFSAKEQANKQSLDIPSLYHREIREVVEQRVHSGRVFGETWSEFLGFFAPFGTKNCFWNRLRASPMLRHIFIHDPQFLEHMQNKSLTDEVPSPQIMVTDVDANVNNCALICALLISIPAGLISNMGSQETYTNMIMGAFSGDEDCYGADFKSSTVSEKCIPAFKYTFAYLVSFVFASFYSSIFTLLSAVSYYMCRPSESYNISSNITLLEAFTIEVRKRIRKERYPTESQKSPTEPFENPNLESEVFSKASFLAQNEAHEQHNQQFYMWYKSESCSSSFFCINFVLALYNMLTQLLDTGGRIFVIGIYLGLIAALITTFFSINVYLHLTAVISEESPFFSKDLVRFMKDTIFTVYTRSWLIVVAAASLSAYICV
jgi:hypothetical protein